MALLKRDLYRRVQGPDITRADRSTLVFDTDSKRLYVEREVVHLEATARGAFNHEIATMDIADYLKQAGQTAGHRELWRALRALFKENSARTELADETWSAAN